MLNHIRWNSSASTVGPLVGSRAAPLVGPWAAPLVAPLVGPLVEPLVAPLVEPWAVASAAVALAAVAAVEWKSRFDLYALQIKFSLTFLFKLPSQICVFLKPKTEPKIRTQPQKPA